MIPILKDFATRQGLGNIGFTSVLHTHSRRRELHPHLHIIVPNGGYNAKRKQFAKGKKGYLFNAFALAKVWRARVLDAIKKHPKWSDAEWQLRDRDIHYAANDVIAVSYIYDKLKYIYEPKDPIVLVW